AIAIDISLTPEQIIEQVIQKIGVTDSVCRG
ncbi:gluconokinase, partial [Acinetobacter baumannii]